MTNKNSHKVNRKDNARLPVTLVSIDPAGFVPASGSLSSKQSVKGEKVGLVIWTNWEGFGYGF